MKSGEGKKLIKSFMENYNTFLSLESWDFNLDYFLWLLRDGRARLINSRHKFVQLF